MHIHWNLSNILSISNHNFGQTCFHVNKQIKCVPLLHLPAEPPLTMEQRKNNSLCVETFTHFY